MQTNEIRKEKEINITAIQYISESERFLAKSIRVVEEHLSEPEFDNVAFARYMNVSKSSLYRKIKSLTGLASVEFIKNIRLKHANRILKSKPVSVSKVAYTVGFNEPKYFSIYFKEEYGITPKEFNKREIKNWKQALESN